MARKLEDQANVIAPTVDFPYGRIRDDDGTGNGTPLTEAVHGDYHQAFARILAQSGVVANDLPDDETVGFQYFEALLNCISRRITEYSSGDDLDATSTDLNDFRNAGIFKVTSSFTNDPAGLTTGQMIVCGSGNDVIQRIIDLENTAEWTRAYTGSWSSWVLVRLAKKIVNIVDWDMDTNGIKTVAHGVANYKRIRTVQCMIRDDADTDYRGLLINNVLAAGANNGGSINLIDATNINLSRIGVADGGFFDGTDYDSTGGFVRGYLTIEFDPAP